MVPATEEKAVEEGENKGEGENKLKEKRRKTSIEKAVHIEKTLIAKFKKSPSYTENNLKESKVNMAPMLDMNDLKFIAVAKAKVP